MPKIKINRQDLVEALTEHTDQYSFVLDKETGEVIRMFLECDGLDDLEKEMRELEEKIEKQPKRYLSISPVSSHEGFRMMSTFVEALPDSEPKLILSKALSWQKPFSNFREALYDYPKIREQWFAYQEAELARQARDWLEVHEVEFEFIK